MAKSTSLLFILYLGFVSLGLPDEILGVAWPTMRSTFGLPLSAAGILVSVITLLGGTAGFCSGYFIKRFSIIHILIASGILTAAGILGTGLSGSWAILILCAVPQGLGAGTIDAALNNYVAENYSSRQMNWLHGFWGVGATAGPLIMTFALTADSNWRLGYLIIAGLQLALVTSFVLTRRLWRNTSNTTTLDAVREKPSESIKYKIYSAPSLMAMGLFFLYTGVEFGTGLWFYSLWVEVRGINPTLAGIFISLFFGMIMFGRFAIGLFSNRLGNVKIVTYSLIGAVICLALLSINNVYLTGLSVIGLGFCLSGIYPCLMHETPKRFGHAYAKVMTGYQAGAASLGVALLSPLVGFILGHSSLLVLPGLLLIMALAMLLLTYGLYAKKA